MHCINVLQLLYPFIFPWTFRLLLCSGFCKYCGNEHWGTCMSFRIVVFSGCMPVVGLLGHMVDLFLVFKGISILFSIMAVPVYIPTNSAGRLLFIHIVSSIYCL